MNNRRKDPNMTDFDRFVALCRDIALIVFCIVYVIYTV